jgi:hypothetical protein
MLVKDILSLVADEEARIKLIISSDHKDEEFEFWLSDYRSGDDHIANLYESYQVSNISFMEGANIDLCLIIYK